MFFWQEFFNKENCRQKKASRENNISCNQFSLSSTKRSPLHYVNLNFCRVEKCFFARFIVLILLIAWKPKKCVFLYQNQISRFLFAWKPKKKWFCITKIKFSDFFVFHTNQLECFSLLINFYNNVHYF